MKEIKADSEKWKGRENQIRGEDSAFKRIDNLKKGENDENSKKVNIAFEKRCHLPAQVPTKSGNKQEKLTLTEGD